MLYSLNVENLTEYTSVQNSNALVGTAFNDFAGRVRGIGVAGRVRDFFNTDLQGDNYNLDSITINSGANAVIYGVGGVAGIVNNTFTQARLADNKYRLELRADSEGSLRAVADVNQPIVPNKLAIRALFLEDQFETHRNNSGGKQSRQFITATLQPFTQTKIRGYYENVYINKIIPRNLVAYDGGVSLYQAHLARGGAAVFDNSLKTIPAEWASVVQRDTNNRVSWVLNSNSFTPIGAFDGTTRYTVRTIDPSTLAVAGADRTFRYSLLTSTGLVNPEYNIHGLTTGRIMEGHIYGATLLQRIGKNLNVELAYNYETGDTDFFNMANPGAAVVRVDVNKYLPDLVTPNPYVGKYYVADDNSQNTIDRNEMNGFRATVSYGLDLRDKSRWLGDHEIAFLYSTDRRDRYWATARTKIISPSQVNTYLYNGGGGAAQGQTTQRFYVDPANGVAMSTPWYPNDGGRQPDGSFVYANSNTPGRGLTFNALQKAEAMMGAIHSRWFDGRLVTTAGLRDAKFTNGSISDGFTARTTSTYANATPNIDNLDYTTESFSKPVEPALVKSYGAVLNLPRGFGIFYNFSDTFEQPSPNYYLGGAIPPASGTSEDYGVMWNRDDGKIGARINLYSTVSANALTCSNCPSIRDQIVNIESLILNDVQNPDSYTAMAKDGRLPAGAPPFDQGTYNKTIDFAAYFMTADRDGKGIEMEGFANLDNGITIRVTAALNEAKETNALKGYDTWIADRYAYWKRWAVWEQTAFLAGSTQPLSASGTSVSARFSNAAGSIVALGNSNGAQVDQNAGWRVNVTLRKNFQNGLLKGSHVGTHLRYREASVLGYKSVSLDNPYSDFPGLSSKVVSPALDQPITGAAQTDVDLFAGYSGVLFKDKVRYSIRLNVRNALDNDGQIPQRADSTGVLRVYSFKEPRLFILTTEFTF